MMNPEEHIKASFAFHGENSEGPSEENLKALTGLLSEFGSKSGVTFTARNRYYISLSPPDLSQTLTDEQLISLMKHSPVPSGQESMRADAETDEEVILIAKMIDTGRYLGGTGITGRDIEQLEEYIPTVTQRLKDERGKIVFLGNGVSDVPLIAAINHANGLLTAEPVVVDIFDYELLLDDFNMISLQCTNQGITIPSGFSEHHLKLQALVTAAQQGNLKFINYYVGSGTPPQEIHNADLIINCMGPGRQTGTEQFSLLRIGGELYTNYEYRTPENISVRQLSQYNSFIKKFAYRREA